MKKVALLSAILFCAAFATAQQYADNWATVNDASTSVDMRVEKATAMLVTRLSLEDNQISAISKIQRKAAENINEIQPLKASSPESYAQKELNIVQSMDRKIFEVLKEKQDVLYKRVLAERMSNDKMEMVKQRQQKAKLQQAFDKN